ncbi:MAG: UbiH/UbiF/VisC/COQ6 family ubiquinone biosynthesis hydroxylase [Gammaproteobacteria bacterium]|nr:UbiH/UbiF/VisC/COQ6 family ubiquinone biosynthesis hydroxylase [Gammaproteobacteria bacterium]
MSSYDVVIVGGGMVGATLALMLAQKTTLQIALIDAKALSADWTPGAIEPRVSAISLASQRIFQHLQIWDAISVKRMSPYRKMHVWDASGSGVLQFDCDSLNLAALGHIIEDNVMRSSIIEKLKAYPAVQLLSPLKLLSLEEKTDCIDIHAEGGHTLRAKLLIAADGGQSWVREQVGIDIKHRPYAHTAMVTTVKTALPHQSTAWQRFLPTGPLAFLPLADEHHSSIVWSTSEAEALRLQALDVVSFQQELSRAFDYQLGEVIAPYPRYAFPLEMRHAKNYVKPRVALVGDAAHTVHPLAGQGVNLGLLDAASLLDVITEALAKKRDFASFATLRRYERGRKSDNLSMLTFVEAIKTIFGSHVKPMQTLRNVGLNMTNHTQFIKHFFANYAVGNRSDLPGLAK